MTTQQKLFNQFIENYYYELMNEFPEKDMLHSAYITVYQIRRPLIPTPNNFRRLLGDAYHRYLLREFQYRMRYTLPDPLFWLYQRDNIDSDIDVLFGAPRRQQDAPHSLADISEKDMESVFALVRSHCSKEAYIAFRLALLQQCSEEQIAEIIGISIKDVRKYLASIEQLLKEKSHLSSKQSR